MSNIKIRFATEDDFPAILSLIKGLAKFEEAEDQVSNNLKTMFQEKEYFDCFVAEDQSEKKILGIALYYFCYFTWVGKSLYLDDLFVLPEHRKKGIGRLLLNRVLLKAKEENCKRVRWQVLDWNEGAISFYKSIGADISSEWLNCTLTQEQIQKIK